MPPQPFNESEMAIQVQGAVTPYIPQQNKENVCADIVPFEANFDQDEISDMDILSAICGVTENVTTTTSITINVKSDRLNQSALSGEVTGTIKTSFEG